MLAHTRPSYVWFMWREETEKYSVIVIDGLHILFLMALTSYFPWLYPFLLTE